MNKNIVIGIIIGAVVLLLGGFFLFNSSLKSESDLPLGQITQTQTQEIKPTTKSSSELVLELSNLPSGFSVADKSPRVESEIGEFGRSQGWIEGYFIKFTKGDSIFERTTIEQSISKYLLENIGNFLEDEPETVEEARVDIMPDPKIGDKSRALRYTHLEFGNREYIVEFTKKDVYMRIYMYGASTNYEELIEIAKKAAAKI